MVSQDGPKSTFQYTNYLSSADCQFRPGLGVKHMRESARIPKQFKDTNWEEFAAKALGEDSLAYLIRVKRFFNFGDKLMEIISASTRRALPPSQYAPVCREKSMEKLKTHLDIEDNFNTTDESGKTILHHMCANLWLKAIEKLLDVDGFVDVDAQDEADSNLSK